MERLDHTNLDFEALSRQCSPFLQRLVGYVIENMHKDMEMFFKVNCRAVDDNEEVHKHRYWDMFKGKMKNECYRLSSFFLFRFLHKYSDY